MFTLPFRQTPACNLIRVSYRISRYPITVSQYQAFVQAGGYTHKAYWREAAAEGAWKDGRLRCRTWSLDQEKYVAGWVERPADYGPAYNAPNQPQVGVSWYEAVAYARWLSEMLGYEVRLPTEAEWERAARHTNGRDYPWGNKFDPRRCNMADTGIGSPAAVGLFAGGDAVCGAADMSGNVWEWCSTQWLDGYEKYEASVDERLEGDASRVVRGGAFLNDQHGVRCASRDRHNQDVRYLNLGFRLVAPGL